MKKFHLESPNKNRQKNMKARMYHVGGQKPFARGTSYRNAPSKNAITMSKSQHSEVRWLYKQYGKPTPTWLRRQFIPNQRRRKCINDNLREAQLDGVFCGKCTNSDEWWNVLHSVWHDINRTPPCK